MGTEIMPQLARGSCGDTARLALRRTIDWLSKPVAIRHLSDTLTCVVRTHCAAQSGAGATMIRTSGTGKPEEGERPDNPVRADGRRTALKILVAEDDSVIQAVILEMLALMGHEVEVVETGAAAVNRVEVEHYDLVLMDIEMPEMDGNTATRAIRCMPFPTGAVPIIGLSANAMLRDREEGLRAGMNDYVIKPFRLEELRAAITRVAVASAVPR
jgi:CheY-like chemotaxis protein